MQFDLVIVGGGLAGLSLACALRETRLKIALVETGLRGHVGQRRISAAHRYLEASRPLTYRLDSGHACVR